MKKDVKFYVIAWVVLVAVFNAIVIAVPADVAGLVKTGGAFWSSYILIMLALVGQLVCALVAFKAENKERFFLNLPLITISYTALIISIIAGCLCMAIIDLPNWVGIIVCIVLLGFSAIAVISARAAAELVERTDNNVQAKTFFIKCLIADTDSLLAQAKSDEVKAEVKKVYEAARYSDPMSNNALDNLEAQITLQMNALNEAVLSDDSELVKSIASELVILINDRSKKCKLLK